MTFHAVAKSMTQLEGCLLKELVLDFGERENERKKERKKKKERRMEGKKERKKERKKQTNKQTAILFTCAIF